MKSLLLAFTLAALPLAAADVSGVWKVDGDVAGNPVKPACTLKQEDTALSGVCKSELGDSPLKGKVDGKKVMFSYDIEFQGQKYTLSYVAELISDTELKGTIDVGVAAGDFTAKKEG
jgi:hypothetical protein